MSALLVVSMACVCTAYPAKLPIGSFQPLHGARGTPADLNRPSRNAEFLGGNSISETYSAPSETYSAPGAGSGFNDGGFGIPADLAGGAVSSGTPDKTIYVRLPAEQVIQPAPISAGPPQKHYRIVIVKAPTPPVVQPVLPPRSEQKTIIYVLHQKPKIEQQVIETPVVKHAPQVLFVGYDDELSTEDLQKLAKGDHSGFTVTSQQDPGAGAAAAVQPSYGDRT